MNRSCAWAHFPANHDVTAAQEILPLEPFSEAFNSAWWNTNTGELTLPARRALPQFSLGRSAARRSPFFLCRSSPTLGKQQEHPRGKSLPSSGTHAEQQQSINIQV